jgi:hypothetical protein
VSTSFLNCVRLATMRPTKLFRNSIHYYHCGSASTAGLTPRSCRFTSCISRPLTIQPTSSPSWNRQRTLFTISSNNNVAGSITNIISRARPYVGYTMHPSDTFWTIYLTLICIIWPIYAYRTWEPDSPTDILDGTPIFNRSHYNYSCYF